MPFSREHIHTVTQKKRPGVCRAQGGEKKGRGRAERQANESSGNVLAKKNSCANQGTHAFWAKSVLGFLGVLRAAGDFLCQDSFLEMV